MNEERRMSRCKGMSDPNCRRWTLTDGENWFETEGGINRRDGKADFTQLGREPLERLREGLKGKLGVLLCPINWLGNAGHHIRLPMMKAPDS